MKHFKIITMGILASILSLLGCGYGNKRATQSESINPYIPVAAQITMDQFAKEHNYPIIETTYNNTPIDYDHVKFAPVLSLKVNADIDSIVHVGKLIEQTIFKNNDQTIYDIVP